MATAADALREQIYRTRELMRPDASASCVELIGEPVWIVLSPDGWDELLIEWGDHLAALCWKALGQSPIENSLTALCEWIRLNHGNLVLDTPALMSIPRFRDAAVFVVERFGGGQQQTADRAAFCNRLRVRTPPVSWREIASQWNAENPGDPYEWRQLRDRWRYVYEKRPKMVGKIPHPKKSQKKSRAS